MKIFNSIRKTTTSKRLYDFNLSKIYRKGRFATSVDYEFFENLNVKRLLELNKKKYNENLIELWAMLDMKSYIDYDLGNTCNLYFINCNKKVPVKQLENYNYMPEETRKMNLLDVNFIKKIKIEGVVFNNVYLAIFEIMDNNNCFRPYVLLYNKDNDKWIEIGYGYDSNDNGMVELFIPIFNYPIYLNDKGILASPLSDKKEKLNVTDYITQKDIYKITKNSI